MDRCPKRCTICADIVLSASLESGDKAVRVTGIEQAHRGDGARAAPGIAVDHEARRADGDVERFRRAIIRNDGADRMLGFCPWDMMKQPRAGRLARRNPRCAASGTDDRSISRSSTANGTLSALCRQVIATTLPAFLTPRRSRSAAVAARRLRLDQLVAVAAAERGDLGPDVGDLEHRRLDAAAGARRSRRAAAARSGRPARAPTAPCSPSCASSRSVRPARARTECDGPAAIRRSGCASRCQRGCACRASACRRRRWRGSCDEPPHGRVEALARGLSQPCVGRPRRPCCRRPRRNRSRRCPPRRSSRR